ncbi:MAG: TlpA family protein disulfide reductase [Clostridia bacterium]|nr:TlpA family protein disulfide reductase [Clostridia bacterium]
MKKSVFVFLLAGVLLLCGCSGSETPAPTGEPLFGPFTAMDLAGESADESIFSQKKLTMVNIWGTFCGPCIQEMPDLGELAEEYGEDLQIVGIVIDAADQNGNPLKDKKEEAERIVSETGADYRHLLPSRSLILSYLGRVQAVPETVFLDENGVQIGRSFMGARSKAEWKAEIEALLEQVK